MNSPSENWLYNALIRNDCHTLVLKIWGDIGHIIGMSTSPGIRHRDHTAQLQYRWHEIDINKTSKTIEIFKDSKINFRDADKATNEVQVDLDMTMHEFLEKLMWEWYIVQVPKQNIKTGTEIMTYLNS